MNRTIAIIGSMMSMLCCKEQKKEGAEAVPLTETVQTITDPWVSLMDAGLWRGYHQASLPENWAFEGDELECFGKGGDIGGDIITKEKYDNFELRLEWKISNGGNSGIFYHVVEAPKYKAPYETGAEYQLLDDIGFPSPIADWQKTGANYAMHLANEKKVLRPIGEWNSSKIIFDRGKVEHWLNGEKIVSFDKFSDDWKTKRNSGKWNDYPDYGIANEGHLGLQDHGAGVWFRNIKVKRL
jgi:hypothetical protein